MSEQLLNSLYLPTLAALGVGILCSFICAIAFRPSRSMLLTSALLAPLVCASLIAVNGSVGTSIAVLGVFGLVRFRSLPAKGTDMICIIYSMVGGLLCACGAWIASYILAAVLGVLMIFSSWIFSKNDLMRIQIVVPESMPKESTFTAILKDAGRNVRLERMKTAGMGTLYELTYTFQMKPGISKADLLEKIRIHNGNLDVTLLNTHDDDQQL